MDTNKPTTRDILNLGLVSGLSGLFIGLAALVVAVLAGWARPWAWGLGGWALVQAIAWLWLLRRSVAVIESILGVDLNRDGMIGEPANPRIIVMDPTDKGQVQGWILDDLPGGEQRFARLARGVVQEDIPLAERYWTGERGPYSLSEFRYLRDYLIMRGLLDWRSDLDHRQGLELRGPGRALLRKYAQLIEDTSPILISRSRE